MTETIRFIKIILNNWFQITDNDFNIVLIIAGSYSKIRNYGLHVPWFPILQWYQWCSYLFHITSIRLYRDIINLETEFL